MEPQVLHRLYRDHFFSPWTAATSHVGPDGCFLLLSSLGQEVKNPLTRQGDAGKQN